MKQHLIAPMNKKGQVGLMEVKSVIITLLVILVLGFAALITVTQLKNSGVFTAGSQEDNDTKDMVNNYTVGIKSFFSYLPTIMVMFGVLVLVGVVVLLIVYITKATRGI